MKDQVLKHPLDTLTNIIIVEKKYVYFALILQMLKLFISL